MNGSRYKEGYPLQYPTTPHNLSPGMYMYPPHPMAYIVPVPMMCLNPTPHSSVKGHNLYFHRHQSVPGNLTTSDIRSSWQYSGYPLVERSLSHRQFFMPPIPQTPYQGIPYIYTPQYPSSLHHRVNFPPHTVAGNRVLPICDSKTSEAKGNKSSCQTSLSDDVKSQLVLSAKELQGEVTDKSESCLVKSGELRIEKEISVKDPLDKNELKEENDKEKECLAYLSDAASEEPLKLCHGRNSQGSSVLSIDIKTSDTEYPSNSSELPCDVEVPQDMRKRKKMKKKRKKTRNHPDHKALNTSQEENDDTAHTPGMRASVDQPISREERTCLVHLKGIITEVHCSMGKLRTQCGKECYFPPGLCFLCGVSLAQVELWHVLIEGQQVQVTLDLTIPELPKVMRVTVEDKDPDSDPDTMALSLQRWCSVNCVSEEATVTLMKQMKGLK